MKVIDDVLYQNIFNNLKQGDVFKNYNQLRETCGLPFTTGRSKIVQRKRLQFFLDWKSTGNGNEIIITRMPEYPNYLYKSGKYNEAEVVAHTLSYFLSYEIKGENGSCCAYKTSLYDLIGLHFKKNSKLTGKSVKEELEHYNISCSPTIVNYIITLIKTEQRKMLNNGLVCLSNRKIATIKPTYITYGVGSKDEEDEVFIHNPSFLTQAEKAKVKRYSKKIEPKYNAKHLFASDDEGYLNHIRQINKMLEESKDVLKIYPCTHFKHISPQRIFNIYPDIAKDHDISPMISRQHERALFKLRMEIKIILYNSIKQQLKKNIFLKQKYDLSDNWEKEVDFILEHLVGLMSVEAVYNRHEKKHREVFFLKNYADETKEDDADDEVCFDEEDLQDFDDEFNSETLIVK